MQPDTRTHTFGLAMLQAVTVDLQLPCKRMNVHAAHAGCGCEVTPAGGTCTLYLHLHVLQVSALLRLYQACHFTCCRVRQHCQRHCDDLEIHADSMVQSLGPHGRPVGCTFLTAVAWAHGRPGRGSATPGGTWSPAPSARSAADRGLESSGPVYSSVAGFGIRRAVSWQSRPAGHCVIHRSEISGGQNSGPAIAAAVRLPCIQVWRLLKPRRVRVVPRIRSTTSALPTV